MHMSPGGRTSDASARSKTNTDVSSGTMLRASGRQQTPAPVSEKRGLKWHSDKSLVDVKDITSRDFDQDFVVAFLLARLRGSAPILAPLHPCTHKFLLNMCTKAS